MILIVRKLQNSHHYHNDDDYLGKFRVREMAEIENFPSKAVEIN